MIDTSPNRPPPTKGNQATYLFFPVFASLVLVLISNLALPVIKGLTVVDVRLNEASGLAFGHWGWCVRSANATLNGRCFANPALGTVSSNVMDLPLELQGHLLQMLAVPNAFSKASVAFHIMAVIISWFTMIWTLAASGEWEAKREHAFSWTKWSFAGTFWTAVFVLVPWALDLALVDRMSAAAKEVAGPGAKATHGAEVWMMMAAFFINFITFAVRVTYLKHKPRPRWTVKGQGGDFNSTHPPPMSAALRPQDEQPPTWDSLNIGNAALSTDTKEAPSVEQKGFAV